MHIHFALAYPRPAVRTEGRLSLLESLMSCLWHPLRTRGRAKGHIYSWPVDVENGAMEIIDFHFSPLFSVALFIILLLPPTSLFLLLLQPGSYLGAGGDLLVSGAASIPCISDEALDCGLLRVCARECVCMRACTLVLVIH